MNRGGSWTNIYIKKDDLKLIINEVEPLFKPLFPLALLLTLNRVYHQLLQAVKREQQYNAIKDHLI